MGRPTGRDQRGLVAKQGDDVLEGAEGYQRIGLAEGELETAPVLLDCGQPVDVGACLLQDSDGLRVGVGPDGLLGEPLEVQDRLGGLVRPAVVIREPIVDLSQPVGVDGLERPGDRAVEDAAAGRRQALVGDVTCQAVGERAERLAAPGLRVEELEAHELPEVGIELSLPHGMEERERHFLSDDGRRLEQAARLVGQAVDPGEQHLLDGVGHREARGGLDGPVDHPRQLLQEEGVPLRLLEDDLGDPVGHRVGAANRSHDAQAVLPRQRRERDLGDVRASIQGAR
jgi:hypothetical protein